MKQNKISYNIALIVFILSIIVTAYSIYRISNTRDKVQVNLNTWEQKSLESFEYTEQKTVNEDKEMLNAIIINREKVKKEENYNKQVLNNMITDKKLFPAKYKERPKQSKVMGKIIISKINESIPIIEGTSDKDLENGAGHYEDSLLPGENGNSIIFGHRDTVFKRLGEVKLKDLITVETSVGKFIYEIVDIRITIPTEEELIKTYNEPILTLITCYPFIYIGHAPKRFVVTAKLKL